VFAAAMQRSGGGIAAVARPAALLTPAPVVYTCHTPSPSETPDAAQVHQRRYLGGPDPAIRQIAQHAHPVDLRPAHRNHRHRPNTPQLKPRRVTSLSGPTVTSLSGVYTGRVACWVVMECLRSGAASSAQDCAYESAAHSSTLTRPLESLDPFMVEHKFRDRARDICVAHER
jgi:hypothetical protein